MIKKLIRSPVGNALVGLTIGSIIALLMITIRWRIVDKDKSDQFMAKQAGIVMVFWHERLIAMPWLWPSAYPLHALQSPHPDGRMMSHAIGCFGVKTVWGSSNRNPTIGLARTKTRSGQPRFSCDYTRWSTRPSETMRLRAGRNRKNG